MEPLAKPGVPERSSHGAGGFGRRSPGRFTKGIGIGRAGPEATGYSSRCSYGSNDELKLLGIGELAAPPRESARLGFASVLLQFKEPQQQVS